jgi:hypothetical protein
MQDWEGVTGCNTASICIPYTIQITNASSKSSSLAPFNHFELSRILFSYLFLTKHIPNTAPANGWTDTTKKDIIVNILLTCTRILFFTSTCLFSATLNTAIFPCHILQLTMITAEGRSSWGLYTRSIQTKEVF